LLFEPLSISERVVDDAELNIVFYNLLMQDIIALQKILQGIETLFIKCKNNLQYRVFLFSHNVHIYK